MSVKFFWPLGLGVAALACAASAQETGASADAIDAIIGRTLLAEGRVVVVNADGTVRGTMNKAEVMMDWDREGELFCREGKVGAHVVTRDCQRVEVEGRNVAFIRADGSVAAAYTFE